jgi:hypothetical protein
MKVCERCGTPNDDGTQFCDTCGTPLAAAPAPSGEDAPAAPPAGGDAPTRIGAAPPVAGAAGPAGAPGPPAVGPAPEIPGGSPAPPGVGPAPQAYAPPGGPPPPPGGGWSPPPSPPPGGGGRTTTLAIVAGVLAFLVLGAAGAGAYFGFIKKDDAKTPTTTTGATTPTTSSTPSTDATQDTSTGTDTTSTSSPVTPAKFRVNVCGRLSPARRCGAPGFNRSRNVKQFYLWLAVLNAPDKKAVRLLLVDRKTRKNLVSPTRFVTTGAKKNIFTLRISGGPFKQLRAAILVKYGRDAITFQPPLRLSLR